MASNIRENFEIDCTCLDLFEEPTQTYTFTDCAIINKCIQNGTLKESDSVCIYGKENCGKTLFITELVADLTAVKELKGLDCKVVFLDCDLTFNYKNYENIIFTKFEKYINHNNNNNNKYNSNTNPLSGNTNPLSGNTNPLSGNTNPLSGNNTHGSSTKKYSSNMYIRDQHNLNQLKQLFLEKSFSNIYYIPIFNPGHLLIILNTLKNLLEQKVFIKALFVDSLSFWNCCKYDKINFFSNSNHVKRKTSDLLDYAFTLILNLKKKFKFLFIYTKLCNEGKFNEYTINLSNKDTNSKYRDDTNIERKYQNYKHSTINKSNYLKQASFLIPQNFNDILKTHIFRKKDFVTKKFLIEKPFFIFLIPNEKQTIKHINNKKNVENTNFLLCLSSEMKDKNKDQYSKIFFMIINSYTIVPL
ncbi:P-loop containing nucleoside triphosphate hydrolase, putative [Hepatocystis sp. ex Piliocolobus tephrosceles]|nr:P-loop containing nucleoside triphosphate hydrolase, putative [Hepatocystis sp. ex Piliocolobus tephrosceles]